MVGGDEGGRCEADIGKSGSPGVGSLLMDFGCFASVVGVASGAVFIV